MDDEDKRYKEGIAYGLWGGCLFGFAGLHRFYLGKPVTGFIWLCTWGLLGFGQFYDLITMRRKIEDANLLAAARSQFRLRIPKKTPEQLLLDAAMEQGGQLTVTQASMITGYSFQQAEQLLREMVASGYVDVGNEPNSGVVIYSFPELQAVRRPDPETPAP